ncbi:hypothetical protein [Streptomyces yangpuensis]|uniref:hypothetical protein n=1 Tax=Streptomyces yangpuensis TaxID=1648182 RepID=UPI003830DCE4
MAQRVYRTGPAAARRSEGYAFGTFTCWATYGTAGAGISPGSSGNRSSTSKNFSNNAT